MTIRGQGNSLTTIDRDSAAPVFRIFSIAPTGILVLESLAAKRGRFTLEGGIFFNLGDLTIVKSDVSEGDLGSLGAMGGGGISNRGHLTLRSSRIFNNGARLEGAAIFNQGTASIEDSLIFGNHPFASGSNDSISNHGELHVIRTNVNDNETGGITNMGVMTITNSTIAGNSNEAIFNFGDMTITNNTIADNTGLGIFNDGNLTVTNSTIASNTSGISNDRNMTIVNSTIADNSGVGINNDGVMTITNSTIARNSVGNSFGAGIENGHGNVLITNSTIAGNSGRGGVGGPPATVNGPIILQNSILALNIDASTGLPSDCFVSLSPVVFSLGNNLIGDPTNCGFSSITASDRLGDPGLGDFIDDGAPGNGRFPLLSSSQAIDGGNEAACPVNDQLGTPRNGPCDIGAIEFYPVVNNLVALAKLTTDFDPATVPNGPAGGLPYHRGIHEYK